jgi:hypothetical protein
MSSPFPDWYGNYPPDLPPPSTPDAEFLLTTEEGVRVWWDPRGDGCYWCHLPGQWDLWTGSEDIERYAAAAATIAADSPDYMVGRYTALAACLTHMKLLCHNFPVDFYVV